MTPLTADNMIICKRIMHVECANERMPRTEIIVIDEVSEMPSTPPAEEIDV